MTATVADWAPFRLLGDVLLPRTDIWPSNSISRSIQVEIQGTALESSEPSFARDVLVGLAHNSKAPNLACELTIRSLSLESES